MEELIGLTSLIFIKDLFTFSYDLRSIPCHLYVSKFSLLSPNRVNIIEFKLFRSIRGRQARPPGQWRGAAPAFPRTEPERTGTATRTSVTASLSSSTVTRDHRRSLEVIRSQREKGCHHLKMSGSPGARPRLSRCWSLVRSWCSSAVSTLSQVCQMR